MTAKIVVVGSANTDMVVQVDTIPHLGETVLGGNFVIGQGGKGANQAVAAARLKADVTFIARLGKDSFGELSYTAYQTEGIKTEYVVWDRKMASGVALILVNQKGDNIIAVAPGANSQLSPDDVYKAEEAIKMADVVLVQLEIPIPAVETAINIARKYRVKVILNPAPVTQLPDRILRKIDYLTPNVGELKLLAQKPSHEIETVAKEFLIEKGIRSIIVTMGAQGALILTETGEHLVSGYSVKAVDTVAAGDAFNGALAVALAEGKPIVDAVRFANAVGALTVTRVGAQPSLPTSDEVNQFLANK